MRLHVVLCGVLMVVVLGTAALVCVGHTSVTAVVRMDDSLSLNVVCVVVFLSAVCAWCV